MVNCGRKSVKCCRYLQGLIEEAFLSENLGFDETEDRDSGYSEDEDWYKVGATPGETSSKVCDACLNAIPESDNLFEYADKKLCETCYAFALSGKLELFKVKRNQFSKPKNKDTYKKNKHFFKLLKELYVKNELKEYCEIVNENGNNYLRFEVDNVLEKVFSLKDVNFPETYTVKDIKKYIKSELQIRKRIAEINGNNFLCYTIPLDIIKSKVGIEFAKSQ